MKKIMDKLIKVLLQQYKNNKMNIEQKVSNRLICEAKSQLDLHDAIHRDCTHLIADCISKSNALDKVIKKEHFDMITKFNYSCYVFNEKQLIELFESVLEYAKIIDGYDN